MKRIYRGYFGISENYRTLHNAFEISISLRSCTKTQIILANVLTRIHTIAIAISVFTDNIII